MVFVLSEKNNNKHIRCISFVYVIPIPVSNSKCIVLTWLMQVLVCLTNSACFVSSKMMCKFTLTALKVKYIFLSRTQ